MTRPDDRWRPTWGWLWRNKELWLGGFSLLAMVQMALVVGFGHRIAERERKRTALIASDRPAAAARLPAGECPPSEKGQVLDEVVVSSLIQSYLRAALEGDAEDAGSSLGALRARRDVALPMLRAAAANARETRLRRTIEAAVLAIE